MPCSFRHPVPATAARHDAGVEYPYGYGPIPVGAVVTVFPFSPDEDGNFSLPADAPAEP